MGLWAELMSSCFQSHCLLQALFCPYATGHNLLAVLPLLRKCYIFKADKLAAQLEQLCQFHGVGNKLQSKDGNAFIPHYFR